ncbi:PIG-M-domain-containing protein [Cercophora scortea]|uniref:GPI mannosyltransferase 1 n=1 Tax=Cercophora scortea TaxID=314031 RepID=A0AAE0M6Y4_9PEZI|nr:PIG-M-domain-containing protein [Cercophora scortea]
MAKPSSGSKRSGESNAPASQKTGAAVSPAGPSILASFFHKPLPLYLSAALLRVVLLLYGLWQDANSPLKYTDIDYLVFTDAARFVSRGQTPYARETYRYTPVLAWLLLPTAQTTGNPFWDAVLFHSGKVLFAAADLVAGWLLERILTMGSTSKAGRVIPGMEAATARKFAAIWLLNPMVAAISTRGSSEGLLGVLVTALLWAVLARRVTLAGLLLGFGVHFKIYPFIYAPAIVWWMDRETMAAGSKAKTVAGKRKSPLTSSAPTTSNAPWLNRVMSFVTPARIQLAVISLLTFLLLNAAMFILHGTPFITHTYLHHVTRIDHRHNFSPYNTQLYLTSSLSSSSSSSSSSTHPLKSLQIESLAFLPQLLLSTVLIPLALAKKSLPSAMLAQTFAFVTFNKVCTSQYFLWYMVLLPLYLPGSSFLRDKRLGLAALALWVGGQALWLQQGYELEFLGRSTFVPGLWVASLGFFLVNCWILGVIVGDSGEGLVL